MCHFRKQASIAMWSLQILKSYSLPIAQTANPFGSLTLPAPKEVLLALEDESVIKWAFNAAFERICLSRFLGYPTGEYLEPESWRCSMIWAATMGLPLSLEGVGAVLGLEKQKRSEGKDLIRYFCQPCTPTKTNGQRTRNRPFPVPDK